MDEKEKEIQLLKQQVDEKTAVIHSLLERIQTANEEIKDLASTLEKSTQELETTKMFLAGTLAACDTMREENRRLRYARGGIAAFIGDAL